MFDNDDVRRERQHAAAANTPGIDRELRPAKFHHALRAWKTSAFEQCLKNEILNLKSGTLPLTKGTTQGGQVDDSRIATIFLRATDNVNTILADVGVFFTEIVGGCSCGDAPMAVSAYCRMQVSIDKVSADADFVVIDD